LLLSYPHFSFQIQNTSVKSRARVGKLSTPHGEVATPAFIFCATKGAIKGASPQQMKSAGTQIMLGNTYHLMLSPGGELIERLGGLHRFMAWDGPLLTDSGGFQVFSMGYGSVSHEIKKKQMDSRPKTVLKITEEGVTFRSYLDGSLHVLTPEKSIQVQRQLGPDFVVVFDECTPYHVDKSYTEKSLHLSHRWGLRCLQEFEQHHDGRQALYGILQGGVYPDLRQQAAEFVNSQPFFGHAVGGSLGEEKAEMYEVIDHSLSLLDSSRPVHLLGIGGIKDIFVGVAAGVDTFDCVHPTRLARHGGALIRAVQGEETTREHIVLSNRRHQQDERPIDATCPCETCKVFSRAYLHYLFRANEFLGIQALILHNVAYMNRLMQAIREAIVTDRVEEEQRLWVHD